MKCPCENCIVLPLCKNKVENWYKNYNHTLHISISNCITYLNCDNIMNYIIYTKNIYNKYNYSINYHHFKKFILLFFLKYLSETLLKEKLAFINNLCRDQYEKSL